MSSTERDIQSQLEEMEADLNQKTDTSPDFSKPTFPQIEINPSPQVQGWIDKTKETFNSLPKFGKVAVAVGGAWLSFSIVGAVLHVVSSIFSIAAVGLVLYVGYRLFSNSESN